MRTFASQRSTRRRPGRVRGVRSEAGAVMVIMAGGMVVLLGMAGLALDSGRAFLVKAQLSRAVDAGVLAGARTLREGEAAALREARAVAEANGVVEGVDGTSVTITVGATELGEGTVTVTARRPMRTVLIRLVGRDQVDIASTATAVVPPIDLVLVIDQSTSLSDMGAWGPLQQAAKEMITYFDDEMDQLGLVSFGVRATHRHRLSHNFTFDVTRAIDAMSPIFWTNTAEGLRLAREQITSPAVRNRAVKVVIFFTDGQPTAARTLVGGEDRVITARDRDPTGLTIGGYYDTPDRIPLDHPVGADGCRSGRERLFCPVWTEGGAAPHGPVARALARSKALAAAGRIREEGVFVYTIGLGNPNATNPLMRPDVELLRRMANEDRISDPDQPRGRTYFAPTPADLRLVFRQVAEDLVVRLTQ